MYVKITLVCYIPLTTEDRTLLAILSRFYSCATTHPPSPPVEIVPLHCLLGLTFPDFDLAPKRKEKFGYFGVDLI